MDWTLFGAGLASNLFNTGLNFLTGNAAHNRDRAEALEDWHRNNEYNSPKEQMKRFEEAGLNPNLVYGQGSSGNSTTLATSAQKSGSAAAEFKLADIYGSTLQLTKNLQQQQQTIENLKTNQELMNENIKLAQANERWVRTWKPDLTEAQIHGLNSSADWKNLLLNPTLDNLNARTEGVRKNVSWVDRLNTSSLAVNRGRVAQMHASTALQTEQLATQKFKTAIAKQTDAFTRRNLEANLEKIYATTAAIAQGRSTSASVEAINKVNAELNASQIDWQAIDRILKTLPFK